MQGDGIDPAVQGNTGLWHAPGFNLGRGTEARRRGGPRSADQTQRGLGRLVGLRKHGGAGLHEDVVAGHLGGLAGDVDVGDAAAGSLEVGLVGGQDLGGVAETGLQGAVVGAIGRNLLECSGDAVQGQAREAGRLGNRLRVGAAGAVVNRQIADVDGGAAILLLKNPREVVVGRLVAVAAAVAEPLR
jgi:hypothetical protein